MPFDHSTIKWPAKSFFYSIRVYTKYGNGELVKNFFWNNYQFDQFNKWKWYFKYWAALLQVKYPRYYIEQSWGPENPNPKTEAKILRDRLINKKGRITQWQRKISEFEKNWNQLFPITDDEGYNKAREKFFRLQGEYESLKAEIKKLYI